MTGSSSTRPRSVVTQTILTVAAAVAFIGAVALVAGPRSAPGVDGPGANTRGGPGAATDVNPEAAEQAEIAEERAEAFEEAEQQGKVGQARPTGPAAAAAAVGWAGEVPVDPVADDWEPAIAADPNASFVYSLVTRYAGKPCSGNCPSPWMALSISSNGGATWSAGKPLCACKGSGQFDPIIEVVPNTGAVYAAYMNGFNVVFTKSTDHGATWSAPVKTYGNVSWNDKPTLAVSDNGVDVYISFNGPTGGDPWMAQSHNSGATWTQTKLVDSSFYYFDFDSDVASDGTVYFAEAALLYGGGGQKGTTPTAPIEEHIFISRDRGATWENRIVATVQPGVACVAEGCTPDFYLGHAAVSADATGKLVYLYDGATTAGGLQTTAAKRSSDGGRTWSAAVTLSATGEESTAPAIESRGSGDVRAWYYQTSGGGNADAWNVWYRTSTDGGATWTAPLRISDANGGAAYKTAAGFGEIYGDYGEMAITNTGKTIAIWGEGASYSGPGGVWFNRQP
ncbi:MAG TPA: sialidase family protein [Candidatus Limnocylindrales bacterium]|nr:sialidase family protein [Candidatus Limnocylindrales bacterium]